MSQVQLRQIMKKTVNIDENGKHLEKLRKAVFYFFMDNWRIYNNYCHCLRSYNAPSV